jgi:hypothetical protein
VRFFRRNETLNERLIREAGLDADRGQAPLDSLDPVEPHPRYGGPSFFGTSMFDNPAVTGNARSRPWEVAVTVDAPAVGGEEVSFVALPDGSLIVEEEEGNAELDPLATAVEEQIAPPYRAQGVRQTESLWAVSARRIQVVELEAKGETIELSSTAEGRKLVVDGMPSSDRTPALEELGEAAGSSYAIHAERLDDDLWEIRVAAL